MKRISQYFLGICIAFTVANIVTIIRHLMDRKDTININSEIFLILIIIIINIILYFMEDLKIKSQFTHITLEFLITVITTFLVGIPMKVIETISIENIVEGVFMIALVYGITILSIYSSIQKDAEDINRKLSGK